MLVHRETIWTLVKNGPINRELIHDWLWLEGTWASVAPAAKRLREQTGEPRLCENYEALTAANAHSERSSMLAEFRDALPQSVGLVVRRDRAFFSLVIDRALGALRVTQRLGEIIELLL